MQLRFGQIALLAGIMIAVFAAVAAVLYNLIPGPLKGTDYLVIGTLATFASLMALFVGLIRTVFREQDLFFKRKR